MHLKYLYQYTNEYNIEPTANTTGATSTMKHNSYMKRKKGYYWVLPNMGLNARYTRQAKLYKGWIVGFWDGKDWWLCGLIEQFNDSDFFEIDVKPFKS